ncbi:hypothetical protein [Corynebacterium glyciniphilum]|uniref:hypothetical protein n=1 Tax=Corynebacterium glyciniphilum TaxID=1404244 RepID=UPI003FD0F367
MTAPTLTPAGPTATADDVIDAAVTVLGVDPAIAAAAVAAARRDAVDPDERTVARVAAIMRAGGRR